MEQVKLEKHQIEAFYLDCFAESQVAHFTQLMDSKERDFGKCVDVGGGCGHFARLLNFKTGRPVRVIDSDQESIAQVAELRDANISGIVGDALRPQIVGDESVICFNLVLHHLIGKNEEATKKIQKKALSI